ncbi:MAG: MBL fold metallo-hydrolase [Prevotellaceae bacterium]|nr:MBL fold metallo-hydrolase [Prevotellaceae bacterium]
MKTTLIMLAFALLAPAAVGQTNTFSYKTKRGNEIILLSEGQRAGNASVLIGATPEIISETMPGGSYPSATNAFLIRTVHGKHILIDTGFGKELFKNLQQYGVTADMIDIILITHMHSDHVGGLLDENGKKQFPNAQLHLSAPEYEYYSNPNTGSEQAIAIFNAYRDKLKIGPFNELEIGSIKAIPAPGHTPGHTAFLINNVLVWGDITHAMAVQMPYPQVAVTYDYDSKQAIETRLKLLEFITKEKLIVAGMHIPYPGMGTPVANGKGGYIFTPLEK